MLLHDLVESAVIDRAYDIVVACDVDDGWLVVVVPFMLVCCWCERVVTVPVVVVVSGFDQNCGRRINARA